MPIDTRSRLLINVSVIKTRKTWESLLLAYPTHGLSHCLDQDKQLELAHAIVIIHSQPHL